MSYEIIRIFNNNVILAEQDGKEMILIGKGIGFGAKRGTSSEIATEDIEKIFHEMPSSDSINYLNIIPKYNEEVIGVSEEIIAKAGSILGSLNPNIHTALIDHITFALDRINMGLSIENPFTDEIIFLYKEEYEVAQLAASLLKERLGVDVGKGEKGFIALHFYSARNNKTISETMQDTRMYKACMEIIVEETKAYDYDKMYVYQSIIFNIKIMLNMYNKDEKINNPLVNEIKIKLGESYTIAEKLRKLINKEKNIVLSDDIIAYIAVDIERTKQY